MKFCPNFLPFLEPKLEDFLSLLHIKYCPIFLPFLEPKLEDPLSLTTYEILPNFFAFFEAKSGGLETHDYPIFCPNFMPFLEPKVEDFLSPTRHEMLPQCSAFLEPKLEDFLFFTKYEILPNFFAFFGAKIGGLSIPYYIWSMYIVRTLVVIWRFFSLTRQKRSKWTGNFDFASVTVNTFTTISFFDKYLPISINFTC